jgi:hypothetical protein
MQMHRYSRNMAMNLEQTKQRENSRAQEGGGVETTYFSLTQSGITPSVRKYS